MSDELAALQAVVKEIGRHRLTWRLNTAGDGIVATLDYDEGPHWPLGGDPPMPDRVQALQVALDKWVRVRVDDEAKLATQWTARRFCRPAYPTRHKVEGCPVVAIYDNDQRHCFVHMLEGESHQYLTPYHDDMAKLPMPPNPRPELIDVMTLKFYLSGVHEQMRPSGSPPKLSTLAGSADSKITGPRGVENNPW